MIIREYSCHKRSRFVQVFTHLFLHKTAWCLARNLQAWGCATSAPPQLSPVQCEKWRRAGQTESAAHEGQAVHTIAYVDDGSPAGTLYSTSSGYLNSWRCGAPLSVEEDLRMSFHF